MDYEKKYKEALERAKEIIECSKNPGSKEVRMVLSFFPELRENEDERIRKELLDIAKTLDKSEWIAWLEKKAEPKEHDVCDNCEQQGNCVSPCCVKLVEKNSEQKPAEWSEEDEKTIHLACEFIRHHSNCNDSINGIDCPILIERLKSLRPQNHWNELRFLKILKELQDIANQEDGCLALENLQLRLSELTREVR